MSFWDAAGTFVRFGFQARWFQEPDDLFVELRISVRITYRYGPTSGKASRSCCTTQSALGCRVTLKWRIWRRAVLDHEEAVQQLERQRRHREEVKCHDRFAVILKKRQPPFIRVATAWNSSQISSHAHRRSRGLVSAVPHGSWGLPSSGFPPPVAGSIHGFLR